MYARTSWRLVLTGLATFAGIATLSITFGQAPVVPQVDPPPPARLPANVAAEAIPLTPPAGDKAPGLQPAVAVTPPAKAVTPENHLERQFQLACRRGAEWLYRANLPTGRFRAGWSPALNRPIEGDHFLHQASATLALARAARFTKDERYAARAAQAVLTLVAETTPDTDDSQARHTMYPSPVLDRLAAAGLVASAIYALPGASDELLTRAEELVRYIARQQRTDGSLRAADATGPADDGQALANMGLALTAVQDGQALRTASWKDEVVRRALPFCQKAFAAKPSVEAAAGLLPGLAIYAARTKDAAAVELVHALADWTCDLQYAQPDPRHPLWYGGFQAATTDGHRAMTAPRADSARLCEGLLLAAATAQAAGDDEREGRYRSAALRGLQFVSTLQYTEANTQHFMPAAREILVGGIHASADEGDLHLADTPMAVCAMVRFLAAGQ